MGKTVAEQTRDAQENLQKRLKAYAEGRPPQRCVGQFLDDEARSEEQYGVYGMGSWVALSEDEKSAIRNLSPVQTLTNQCRDELRRLVQAADAGSAEQKAAVLQRVIPKMCYAYLGLSRFHDCQPEANLLAGWIATAQRAGGAWGYLTSSPDGCPEMTAYVIRHFAREQTLSDRIRNAIQYLRAAYPSIGNPFLRLYALNTLLLHDVEGGSAKKPAVKETVAKLLNQAFFNPTQFPNPINLDFNDANRTRYIRLSTDGILLESMELISGTHRLYVRGHPGKRVFKHLMETLNVPPSKDTTGHRLTPPSALYMNECLKRLTETRQWRGIGGLVEDAFAYLACAWSFGVNIEWNVISVLVSGAGVCVFYFLWNKPWLLSACAGALVKSFLDLGKSLYNTLRRFGGE